MMSERLGRISFWLTFTGFNICFLPMHLTGLAGHAAPGLYLPRRGWAGTWLNMISTVGAFVIAAGILVFAWDLVRPKGASR